MRLRFLPAIAMTLGLGLPAAHAERPPAKPADTGHGQWNAPQKPLRIHGRTWYVGPHGLSALVLDTGHGLVLIDGGLPASASVIEANIRALGFRVSGAGAPFEDAPPHLFEHRLVQHADRGFGCEQIRLWFGYTTQPNSSPALCAGARTG